MAHQQQQDFFQYIKNKFPYLFTDVKVLDINNIFSSFEFQYNPETCGLYFWGIKK